MFKILYAKRSEINECTGCNMYACLTKDGVVYAYFKDSGQVNKTVKAMVTLNNRIEGVKKWIIAIFGLAYYG